MKEEQAEAPPLLSSVWWAPSLDSDANLLLMKSGHKRL